MRVKNGKDFWAGLMFIGFGLGFMLVSLSYPMGTAVRMGSAYFPSRLGGMLAILGVVIFIRTFVSKEQIENSLRVFLFRWPMLLASFAMGGVTYFANHWLKDIPMAKFSLAGVTLILFIGAFGKRSMFLIMLAVVIFGAAIQPLGLVLAIAILIMVSALGGHDFRKKEIVILTIVQILFGVLVFVKGLGLPFNLWPGGD